MRPPSVRAVTAARASPSSAAPRTASTRFLPVHEFTRMISDQDFLVRYGPWALVAGGSLGMGAEYSRQLARRGLNVVLVAEAPEPLQPLAAALAREHVVETRAIVL